MARYLSVLAVAVITLAASADYLALGPSTRPLSPSQKAALDAVRGGGIWECTDTNLLCNFWVRVGDGCPESLTINGSQCDTAPPCNVGTKDCLAAHACTEDAPVWHCYQIVIEECTQRPIICGTGDKGECTTALNQQADPDCTTGTRWVCSTTGCSTSSGQYPCTPTSCPH